MSEKKTGLSRRSFLKAAGFGMAAYGVSRLVPEVEIIRDKFDHGDLCDPKQIGRSYRDKEGRVFMCVDGGNWVQQGEDPGIIYSSDGHIYKRVGDVPPGQYPETHKFSHWAGKKRIDEETGKEVRNACFGSTDGLGCDMTYEVTGKWIDNSVK